LKNLKQHKTVSDLVVGEKAIIFGFTDSELTVKLLEMGCLPGTEITLKSIAPLGDPISISVLGYQLALRKEEANCILLNE
jgi:ferrous iron transport protein A